VFVEGVFAVVWWLFAGCMVILRRLFGGCFVVFS